MQIAKAYDISPSWVYSIIRKFKSPEREFHFIADALENMMEYA